MFDIGFWELTVIAVVALLVVGPEELPALARTTSRWLNKARRFMSDMKDELEHEVDRGKELKERIVEESKIADAHRALSETSRAVSTIKKDLQGVVSGDMLNPVPKTERDQVESESPTLTPQNSEASSSKLENSASAKALPAQNQALSDKADQEKPSTHGKTS